MRSSFAIPATPERPLAIEPYTQECDCCPQTPGEGEGRRTTTTSRVLGLAATMALLRRYDEQHKATGLVHMQGVVIIVRGICKI